MNDLIGIAGKKGSGKDTLGRMFQGIVLGKKLSLGDEELLHTIAIGSPNLRNSGYIIKKFAGKLKKIASILLGVPAGKFEDPEFKKSTLSEEWNYRSFSNVEQGWEEKEMTVRKFLQKIGTDAMRTGLHRNVWVNALFADFEEKDKWIITDVRFENEAEAIRKRNGILIRVERPPIESDDLHPSEIALDDYPYYDHKIINNGSIYDLLQKAKELPIF